MRRISPIWALAVTSLLCFGPLVSLFFSGLTASGQGTGTGYDPVGLTHYAVMLRNTVAVAGGATLLSLVLAAPLALILFRLRVPFQTIFLALTLSGAVLPVYIYAAAWLRRMGNSTVGSDPTAQLWNLSVGATKLIQAAIISGLAKAPLTALLLGLSLCAVDTEAEEAAWLDTRKRGVIRHVLMRHLLRGAVFAGSITLGLCLGEIAVTDMLAVRTLAEETYMQFQLTLDPERAALTGMAVFVPILIPWLLLLFARQGAHVSVVAPIYSNQSSVFRCLTAPMRGMLCTVTVLLLAITLGVPFARLIPVIGGPMTFLTNVRDLLPEIAFSSSIAVAAAAVSVSVAFPLVQGTRGSFAGSAMLGMALAGLFVPGSVLGIALVKLFNRAGVCGWIYSSPLILLLGQALRFFPLTLLALWIFLQATPRQYDDMTATDGLSFWKALWHVHLPINGPAVFLSWALVFVWCLGELDTSIIVCPPGTTTLPIRIFTMLHYGVYSEVATACLLLAGTIFIVACLGLIAGQSHAEHRAMQGAETHQPSRKKN